MSDALDTPRDNAAQLTNKLNMGHLDDLRAEIEAAQRAVQNPDTVATEKPDTEADDPRSQKRYSFDVRYEGRKGQWTTGRFTNKILSIGEKITVGTMRARLQMGVSLDAMSADTYNLLFMVTWLQQSLTDKPKWADDLFALESEGLVKAIFDQVDSHERFFHGEVPGAEKGETAV